MVSRGGSGSQALRWLQARRKPWSVLVALLLGMAFLSRQSCDTRASLRPLLLSVVAALDGQGVAWSLTYGTLLGAFRDGDLLAHEFDNDVTLMQSPALAGQMDAVKATLAKEGLTLYREGEHSVVKGLLNLYFGSYDPYIGDVQYRVYDRWMVRLTACFPSMLAGVVLGRG